MKIKDRTNYMKKAQFAKLIGFIVFLLMLFKTFSTITYIFRNTGFDREHMVGIKNEKFDVICIGASSAHRYWQPLKAWHDCGFTSYLYTHASMQVESMKACVQEARKSQEPELFVIEVRPFRNYSDEPYEAGIRKGTDGMDITSIFRYKLINEYFENRNISASHEILYYYFDIAKYHTNIENLGSSEAWGFKNNEGVSLNKGWEWGDDYGYLEEPVNYETEVRGELEYNAKKVLLELLDYCKREELNVLFVVSPYYITEEDQEVYNTIGDIVESYDFDYLNTNLYYNEMELDFSTDFYNKNHVNLFGAEKYTEFLEEYIVQHYNITNHCDDENYISWDEDYKRFLEERAVHAEAVTNLRLEEEKGLVIANEMKQTNNLAEWDKLTEDTRFTILMISDGKLEWPQNMADRKTLEKWGFSETDKEGTRVICDKDILNDIVNDRNIAEGTMGKWSDHSYYLLLDNNKSLIMLDGVKYSGKQHDITAIVFDNNYGKVVDSVMIYNEGGRLRISR